MANWQCLYSSEGCIALKSEKQVYMGSTPLFLAHFFHLHQVSIPYTYLKSSKSTQKKNPRHTIVGIFYFYYSHNPLIISSTHPSPHFQIFKLTHFQINFHIPKFPHLHIPLIFKLSHFQISHFQINTLSHS